MEKGFIGENRIDGFVKYETEFEYEDDGSIEVFNYTIELIQNEDKSIPDVESLFSLKNTMNGVQLKIKFDE